MRVLARCQILVQFTQVFEHRDSWKRFDDFKNLLNLRLHIINDACPPRALTVLRALANTRNPALLMNFSSARSKMMSLTGWAKIVESCRSSSGAVAVSRLPMSRIVVAYDDFWH
jgi:hypothetical protein